HGTTGIAGEIGHCPVPGATERCNCGKIGCLETVASGNAIVTAALQALAGKRKSSLSSVPAKRLTAEDIGTAAAEGDELAREILASAGAALGLGLSWLVNLLNPQLVVVGGG